MRRVTRGRARLVGRFAGRYKKKSAAAMTAMTATVTSKSTGVRIGLPRCGVHGAFGVGKLKVGRLFMVASYPAFRQRTARITRFAEPFSQKPTSHRLG